MIVTWAELVIASFMWVIWKTRFVFMGVTGNPFVSCPQLRAISASYTVYKAINHAMNCTHKRKCTPARLFILCRLQNIRQLSKLTFPGEDFHLLTHSACSIYTRMQKKKKRWTCTIAYFLQIHFPVFPRSSLFCELGT